MFKKKCLNLKIVNSTSQVSLFELYCVVYIGAQVCQVYSTSSPCLVQPQIHRLPVLEPRSAEDFVGDSRSCSDVVQFIFFGGFIGKPLVDNLGDQDKNEVASSCAVCHVHYIQALKGKTICSHYGQHSFSVRWPRVAKCFIMRDVLGFFVKYLAWWDIATTITVRIINYQPQPPAPAPAPPPPPPLSPS